MPGLETGSASWLCTERRSHDEAAAAAPPEPFDGVAELWFDVDELLRLLQTDSGVAAAQALLEDERRLLDLARPPIFVAEDYVAVG